MQLNYLTYEEALKSVDQGWLIQYQGEGLISDWIKLVSGGIHTHSAMVIRREDGSLAVAEMREFKGGRITSLYEQYKEHKGRMDFYRPNTEKYPELNLQDTANGMKFIVKNGSYSYFNLLKILIRRVPLLWRFFDRGIEDDEMVNVDEKKWHCSDSVAAAYQYGGVDPVPAMPHELVSPSDLTNSLLFSYQFSL